MLVATPFFFLRWRHVDALQTHQHRPYHTLSVLVLGKDYIDMFTRNHFLRTYKPCTKDDLDMASYWFLLQDDELQVLT